MTAKGTENTAYNYGTEEQGIHEKECTLSLRDRLDSGRMIRYLFFPIGMKTNVSGFRPFFPCSSIADNISLLQ